MFSHNIIKAERPQLPVLVYDFMQNIREAEALPDNIMQIALPLQAWHVLTIILHTFDRLRYLSV